MTKKRPVLKKRVAGALIPNNQIKRERRISGMTQEDLVYELNVSEGTVRRWEQGHIIPSDQLLAMARMWGVSCDYLLGRRSTRDKFFRGEDVGKQVVEDPGFEEEE